MTTKAMTTKTMTLMSDLLGFMVWDVAQAGSHYPCAPSLRIAGPPCKSVHTGWTATEVGYQLEEHSQDDAIVINNSLNTSQSALVRASDTVAFKVETFSNAGRAASSVAMKSGSAMPTKPADLPDKYKEPTP